MAIPIIPILSLGSSIFNAINGGKAINKASGLLANTQYGAANDITDSTGAGQGMVAQGGNDAITAVNNATGAANERLEAGLGNVRSNLDPYLSAGSAGASALTNKINNPASFSIQDWINDPGFQFLMQQGSKALNNTAAARGSAVGTNALQNLTRFGQGLAATEYDSAFDRFMRSQQNDLANITAATNTGLSASSQLGNAELGTAANVGQNIVNAGRYQGDTNQSVAQFLANLGLQGTNLANQYRIGGANTQAAGILGKAGNIAGAVNQGVQTIPSILPTQWGGGGNYAVGNQMASLPLNSGLPGWQPGR